MLLNLNVQAQAPCLVKKKTFSFFAKDVMLSVTFHCITLTA